MNQRLERFKPGVPKAWLLLLAGVVWTLAGALLCFKAFTMLTATTTSTVGFLGIAGTFMAVAWNRFMFSRVAQENVGRITRLPRRACVFAFTPWKGYAIIAVMIILGTVLRSTSIPGEYLGIAHITMGGTLLLSSRVFFRNFFAQRRTIHHH